MKREQSWSGARFLVWTFLGLLVASELTAATTAPLKVTVTVGMVADLVRQVGGDEVVVTALMGPGVDPHMYKATASDLIKLQRAEVIFYSGLHLEGKMQGLFEKMAAAGRPVRAATDGVDKARLLKPSTFEGQYDPHVWFDTALWSGCIQTIQTVLTEARPAAAPVFTRQAEVARERLEGLDRWVKMKADQVDRTRRILVTSHDAFNYFGRAYGFKVVALQGVSTVTEAGLADVTQLVDFIRTQKVPAIFVESSVPHGTIERISRDAGVRIGGELFSDALGTPGKFHQGFDLGTYEGMVHRNVDLIVEALK